MSVCATMVGALILLASIVVRVSTVTLPPPYTEQCLAGERLNPVEPVPTYVINLNEKPAKRWARLASDYSQKIIDMLVVKNITYPLFHGKVIKFVDSEMSKMNYYLPQPYQDEIQGIATVLKIPVGQIVINLDFGLLLGWSPEQHDWLLTNTLRPLVVNIDWQVNGRVIFKSTNFAGFIGVLNGVKPKAFSLSANERFDWNGGYLGVMEWLMRLEDNKWMFWITREIMEKAGSYQEAVTVLKKVRLMAPIYFIVGGAASGNKICIKRAGVAQRI
ncbi:unnamed protein product [Soboliphyme baturini]|uniref:ceramidase n=1 Tax=Soboliphyme baturini TaxID=241478 RepID=A0A183IUM7_9BILA|nr:unnamed protein product [Soboliphyme baturini]